MKPNFFDKIVSAATVKMDRRDVQRLCAEWGAHLCETCAHQQLCTCVVSQVPFNSIYLQDTKF